MKYIFFFLAHSFFFIGCRRVAHDPLEVLPKECYYTEAVVKPEICHEYIISRYSYLSARAGLSVPIKGGLFTKGRKGLDSNGEEGGSDPFIKQDRKAHPFFNFGLSYSLFK